MPDNAKPVKLEVYLADQPLNKNDESSYFQVMINPATITYNTAITYVQEERPGGVKPQNSFNNVQPETITFKLVIDGTGAVNPKETRTVHKQIDNFRRICYDYNGENHEPNTVVVAWGESFQFECKLKTLTINYKLFKTDGMPIRAEMDVSFVVSTDVKTEARLKNNSSPDLSHVRMVKEGDTLPLMCKTIYGNPLMYLEVARINGLVNFRSLTPGMEIVFPPIKK